jgi:hypothetical protein
MAIHSTRYTPLELYRGIDYSPDMANARQFKYIIDLIADVLGDNGETWDDFSVPLTRDKQGANSKPDYDFTNCGLLFPNDDATEIVYLTFQMSHSKKLDTDIHLHVHYVQDEAGTPVFKIDYRWYNNGVAVPAGWTTISTGDGSGPVFSYDSGAILQILPFPTISPPSNEAVSSNLDVRFYRDDAAVAGDVLAKYIDFHYVKDQLGSDDEYEK